ncbi:MULTISPECIES: hypothetical protein [Micromonospora]|uniref:hypothetical protein n=1 Tax=Micromonospora TaxID=1873 RepID=UPI000F5D5A12|nr:MULTISPECIES: hypothetical protein [Micromonospora]
MSNGQGQELRESERLQYLGTALTAAPFAVAIIRIAAVSELNPTVLAILLQTANYATLFIRSVIDLLPMVAVIMVATVVATKRVLMPGQKRRVGRLLQGFIVFGWLGVLFITPLHLAALIAIIAAWLLLYRFVHKDITRLSWSKRREAERKELREQILLAAGMLAGSLLILSQQMWLPPQILEYGTERHVAYVLEEKDRTTTLLTEPDRRLLVVNTDIIQTRQPCTKDHSWASRPLISLISNQSPRLPNCPEK